MGQQLGYGSQPEVRSRHGPGWPEIGQPVRSTRADVGGLVVAIRTERMR